MVAREDHCRCHHGYRCCRFPDAAAADVNRSDERLRSACERMKSAATSVRWSVAGIVAFFMKRACFMLTGPSATCKVGREVGYSHPLSRFSPAESSRIVRTRARRLSIEMSTWENEFNMCALVATQACGDWVVDAGAGENVSSMKQLSSVEKANASLVSEPTLMVAANDEIIADAACNAQVEFEVRVVKDAASVELW
jgi:hypothetical protein